MKLREVLSAPFILRSESVELDDGTWVRVVSYPELGCKEVGRSMPEVMERLEASKLYVLIDRCLAGTPPSLRQAVPDPTVELRLARAGLESFIARLEDDVADLARSQSARAGAGPRRPG